MSDGGIPEVVRLPGRWRVPGLTNLLLAVVVAGGSWLAREFVSLRDQMNAIAATHPIELKVLEDSDARMTQRVEALAVHQQEVLLHLSRLDEQQRDNERRLGRLDGMVLPAPRIRTDGNP